MDSLKVLTEVVKTQSFTKAAENLYTSQPSISRDIKRLELEYDFGRCDGREQLHLWRISIVTTSY